MADATPEIELVTALKATLGPAFSATMGFLWQQAEEIRNGGPFSWRIMLLSLPSNFGIGIIAGGLGLWLELPLLAAMGIACATGYLGTRWLTDILLPRLLNKWFPPKKEEENGDA